MGNSWDLGASRSAAPVELNQIPSMTATVALTAEQIHHLDLSPLQTLVEAWLKTDQILDYEQQLQIQINYLQDPDDPRELPEIPEIRLWFLRLDARYPWMPFLLDWKSGELVRYTAMLVPHQFHPKDGIQYNPEALELFVTQKLFVLMDWMKSHGIESRSRLKSMAQMLGYELDDVLFDLLSQGQ